MFSFYEGGCTHPSVRPEPEQAGTQTEDSDGFCSQQWRKKTC